MDTRVTAVWKLLRYSYAAVVFLVGLDKVLGTYLIVNWPKYVSPLIVGLLPFSMHTFIFLVGVIEILVAIVAVTHYTALASYVSAAWLIIIALNLLTIGGYVDVAARDLLLAVGAFAAGMLADAHGYGIMGKKNA